MDLSKIITHIKLEDPGFVFTGGSDISRFYESIKSDKKKKGALILLLAGILAAALKHNFGKPEEPEPVLKCGRRPVPMSEYMKHAEPMAYAEPGLGYIAHAEPSLGYIAHAEPSLGYIAHAEPSLGYIAHAEPSLGYIARAKPVPEHRKLLTEIYCTLTEREIKTIEGKLRDDEKDEIPRDFINLLEEFNESSINLYWTLLTANLFKAYLLSSEKYDDKYIKQLIAINKEISNFPYEDLFQKWKFPQDNADYIYRPVHEIHKILRNYNLGMYPANYLTILSINVLLFGFSEITFENGENSQKLIEYLHIATTEKRKILNYTFAPFLSLGRNVDLRNYIHMFLPFFNYLENFKYDFTNEKITVDILKKHYNNLVKKKITDFKEKLEKVKINNLPDDLFFEILKITDYIFTTKAELEEFSKQIIPDLISGQGYLKQIEENQKMKFPTLVEFLAMYNPVDEKTGNLYPIPATSPNFFKTFDIKTDDIKFEGIPANASGNEKDKIIEKNKDIIKKNLKFRVLVRNLFIKDMNFIKSRFGYYPSDFMSYYTPRDRIRIDPNILATRYIFPRKFDQKLALVFLIRMFNAFAANRESHFENHRLLEIETPGFIRYGNEELEEIPADLSDLNSLADQGIIGAGYSNYIFVFMIIAIIILIIVLKNEIYNTVKYVFGNKTSV